MSKAFTRESDDIPETRLPPRHSTLPLGVKNYLTWDGDQRMRSELERLRIQRALMADHADTNTAQKLLKLDEEIQNLNRVLNTAVVVSPPQPNDSQVHFGATVTIRNQRNEQTRYRLVGVDETDMDRGWVSWLSPIARALLNAHLGERVRVKLPSGLEELEIVRIEYEGTMDGVQLPTR